MEPGHKSRWGLGKRKGMAGMPETWASARAIAQGQSSQREDSNLLAELQRCICDALPDGGATLDRSEEHTSKLQSLMRISYAVFCLKKKKQTKRDTIKSH